MVASEQVFSVKRAGFTIIILKLSWLLQIVIKTEVFCSASWKFQGRSVEAYNCAKHKNIFWVEWHFDYIKKYLIEDKSL